MKRKLIVIMFAVTASACACGLLACGGGNGDGGEGQTPPHVHTYIDIVVAPTCTERDIRCIPANAVKVIQTDIPRLRGILPK